ncbi:unnamed protein product, partial [Pylaiella littoralis]
CRFGVVSNASSRGRGKAERRAGHFVLSALHRKQVLPVVPQWSGSVLEQNSCATSV